VLNIFLPEEFIELEEDDFDPEAYSAGHGKPDLPAKAEPCPPAGSHS
jgi:hypothetical protein